MPPIPTMIDFNPGDSNHEFVKIKHDKTPVTSCWDITTKEKALFETALDKENLSWEEPLPDEPGEFHESEKPDTMAGSPKLEEEVNSPVNDDCDPPFSERLVAEKRRSQ